MLSLEVSERWGEGRTVCTRHVRDTERRLWALCGRPVRQHRAFALGLAALGEEGASCLPGSVPDLVGTLGRLRRAAFYV